MKTNLLIVLFTSLFFSQLFASSAVWKCSAENSANGASWNWQNSSKPTKREAITVALGICEQESKEHGYLQNSCILVGKCEQFYACTAENNSNGASWGEARGATLVDAQQNAIRICEQESKEHGYPQNSCFLVGNCAQP